jgi:hypothetical protein
LLIFLALGAYYVFVERNKPSEQEMERIEKTVLEFERAGIGSLEMRLEGEDIRCVKAGEQWEMQRPVETQCDETLIAAILEALSSLQAERFLPADSGSPDVYGLDTPAIEVSVASTAPADSHWIMIGDQSPTGNTYFAYVDTKDRIALLPSSVVDGKLKVTAFDFRDKTVLDFEVVHARVLTIAYDDTKIAVERAYQRPWNITGPIEARADETEINSILWDIENAKVREFIDEPGDDLSVYGLDPPAVTVRVLVGASKSLRRLDFGKETEEGGLVYAKSHLKDNVMLVDKRLVEKVQTADLMDLREKRLFDFAADDVAAMDIVMGDSIFSCARDTSGEWTTTGAERVTLKKWKMNGVASQLSFLRAFSFVDDPNPDVARMGLDRPQLVVTASLYDTTSAVLEFGTAEGDEIFIRAGGQYATVSGGFATDLKDILRNPPYVEEETTNEQSE